jgi:rhodanese-related sulfurtransferase
VLIAGSWSATAARASEPWAEAQLISPEKLKTLLAEPQGAELLVIHVGFRALYTQGHIPGSQYLGPAARPEGAAELKKFLEKIPRQKEIILYCGCCPWQQCPNIRPAFRILEQMGFKRVEVLDLPTSLAADWAQKGYPIAKGN